MGCSMAVDTPDGTGGAGSNPPRKTDATGGSVAEGAAVVVVDVEFADAALAAPVFDLGAE